MASIVGCLLTLTLAAAACGAVSSGDDAGSKNTGSTGTKNKSDLTIGFTATTLSLAIIADAWKAAQAEAKTQGVKIKGVFEADAAGQDAGVRNLIAQKVDALVIDPNDSKAIGTVIEQANQAGIPVVMMIGDNDGAGETVSYVGANEETGSYDLSKQVFEALGGHGNVAYIQGNKAQLAGNLREKGFRRALDENKGIKLTGYGAANWLKQDAFNLTQNLMSKDGSTQAILTAYDDMAEGAIEATKSSGKKLLITGVDGTCNALSLIWNGGMYATVDQLWAGIAATSVDTAIKAALGETVEKRIETPSYVITKDAMQQVRAGTFTGQTPALKAQVEQAIAGCKS